MIAVDVDQPARLHPRSPPHRRRHAVRRRPGHGDEARAAARRDRPVQGRAHRILLSPAGRPLTQARVAELAKLPTSSSCAAATKASTSARSSSASTRRSRSATTCCRAASSARSCMIDAVARLVPGVLGEPDVRGRRVVLARPARVSAVHAARRARAAAPSRRCSTSRQPRRDRRVAPRAVAPSHRRAPPRSVPRATPDEGRRQAVPAAPRAHAPRARPSSGRRSHGRGRHDRAHQLRHPRSRALVDDVRPRRLSHRHADHLAARQGRAHRRAVDRRRAGRASRRRARASSAPPTRSRP